MTRSYTLENWDGHLAKFESHRLPHAVRGQALSPPLDSSGLPVFATSDLHRPGLFSSNSKASDVEQSLNCGPSKSHHSTDDASNERPHLSTPRTSEKTRFDISDFSDTQDHSSDILTVTLDPSSSVIRDDEPRSPSISKDGTRRSGFPPYPTSVPSPALTIQTISAYTADAHGEEEDEDVIILGHIRTSFSTQTKSYHEVLTNTSHDSLFTPPPSDTGSLHSSSESPLPIESGKKPRVRTHASRKVRVVAAHVLVPPLSKPKSEYVNLSSLLIPPRKRPRRTAQDHLKDVLNAVWQNNENLEWSGGHDDGDGDRMRKKRKRKHKHQEERTRPIAEPSHSSHDDEESVVFVNRTPAVKRLVEEKPRPAETIFIDLTLDNDEEHKPLNLLSMLTHSVTQVMEETSPGRQPASQETQISVTQSISDESLLHNTCFLRGTNGDTHPHKDIVTLHSLLPFRRRRAMLDNDLEESSFLGDEFSLGVPVVTESELKMFDEDSDDDKSAYDVTDLLDSSSASPVPKFVLSPGTHPPPCLPKIDLAAKFRKKKTPRRTPSVLTPVGAVPFQHASTSVVSHLPASPLMNGHVQDVMMNGDGYDPHTPLIPSAKALGKRKAFNSPFQELRSEVEPLFPSSRLAESISAYPADNSFESFINYYPASPDRPMTLISGNPSLHLGAGDADVYPDPYPNITLSNLNFVDHRHHQPPSPYSSVEPPYHSPDYTGTPVEFGRFTGSVLGDPPPPSESTLLPAWSSELDTCFHYDGTVNPSLLGGEPLGMSEHPESYFPDAGTAFLDTEKEPESHSMSMMSPSHSHSPMTLSTSPKSDPLPDPIRRDADSETVFIRRQPTTTSRVSGSPNDSKRRRVQRSMPDMVPSAVLSLSSSSSSEADDELEDESERRSIKPRGGARTTPSNQQPTKPRPRPTVARKVAAVLPAALNKSGPKVMIGGQLWPMQDEPTYCHQCRNKTTVLKLECRGCSKVFCVRCLTTRYPDEPRALGMKKAGCPACLGYCNCTACCSKRGVQYISTRKALAGGIASQARLKAQGRSKLSSSRVASSSSLSPVPDVVVPSPSLYSRAPLRASEGVYWGVVYGADGSKIGTGHSFAKEDVSEQLAPAAISTKGEGVYWGVVYRADGSTIGKGFTFAKEDVERRSAPVTLTKPVSGTPNVQPRTKQKRVYVGKIHPSWRFDGVVKKSVLEPVPPPRRVHESRRPRKYVGNKAFLFSKSEKMARDLADLSPLSSLEEEWDEEDWGMDVEGQDEEWDAIGIVGRARDDDQDCREDSKDGTRVSLGSLSDRDVLRAIGLGLNACGIQFAE